MSPLSRNRRYLGLSAPAESPGVPHLPVLDKLGPRTQTRAVRKVFVQKRCRHGGNHQGTGALWSPGQQEESPFIQILHHVSL